MPSPDDIDRDRIYTADVEDDDAELELEPPDAEVLAAEERRAQEAIDATMMSVDIDEIYRDADRRDERRVSGQMGARLSLSIPGETPLDCHGRAGHRTNAMAT